MHSSLGISSRHTHMASVLQLIGVSVIKNIYQFKFIMFMYLFTVCLGENKQNHFGEKNNII